MTFQPETIRAFHFGDAQFDPASGTATLRYRFEPGPEWVERFEFSGSYGQLPPAFFRALHWLHLAAGVSYYKLALPKTVTSSRPLTESEAEFFAGFYRDGLAELGYRNQLQLPLGIEFPAGEGGGRVDAELVRGTVVPLGGGKDSLVSCELLRAAHHPFRTLAIGRAPLIERVSKVVAVPHVRIRRTLDPKLQEYSRVGGYSGHVPITGILAFAKFCGAFLHNYDTVVMSNERSADEPTLTTRERYEVNHQYSKSTLFEERFAALIHRGIASPFRYFSLLRPWSELAIAKRFADVTLYDDVFSSCNRNFGQSGKDPATRWCGACPKCRFVHLALAPFVDHTRLKRIFGQHPLDDRGQLPDYEALLGLAEHKPFECVGEIGESRAAMAALINNPNWSGRPIVRALAENPDWDPSSYPLEQYVAGGPSTNIPTAFRSLLREAAP